MNVVKQLENYALAMGDRYLRDLTELRAGEDYEDRLQEMIEEADVFQLFWSHRSAGSPAVEREWRHALTLDRQAFIRPTYWEDPMPQPPEELAIIHFQRLGLETEPVEAKAEAKVEDPKPSPAVQSDPKPEATSSLEEPPAPETSPAPSLGKPMRPPPGKEPASEPPPDWRRGAGAGGERPKAASSSLSKPSARTRAKAQPWRTGGERKARTGTTAKVQLEPQEAKATSKSEGKSSSMAVLILIIVVSILAIAGSVYLLMR